MKDIGVDVLQRPLIVPGRQLGPHCDKEIGPQFYPARVQPWSADAVDNGTSTRQWPAHVET